MILDTSALVAMVVEEAAAERVLVALENTEVVGIGTPTLCETGIVLSAKLGNDARMLLARILQEVGIEVIPFGPDHWLEAVGAFLRFGKGRHPAGLNFGDCMTYAVARLAGQPLLCVGNDFSRTDLTLV